MHLRVLSLNCLEVDHDLLEFILADSQFLALAEVLHLVEYGVQCAQLRLVDEPQVERHVMEKRVVKEKPELDQIKELLRVEVVPDLLSLVSKLKALEIRPHLQKRLDMHRIRALAVEVLFRLLLLTQVLREAGVQAQLKPRFGVQLGTRGHQDLATPLS